MASPLLNLRTPRSSYTDARLYIGRTDPLLAAETFGCGITAWLEKDRCSGARACCAASEAADARLTVPPRHGSGLTIYGAGCNRSEPIFHASGHALHMLYVLGHLQQYFPDSGHCSGTFCSHQPSMAATYGPSATRFVVPIDYITGISSDHALFCYDAPMTTDSGQLSGHFSRYTGPFSTISSLITRFWYSTSRVSKLSALETDIRCSGFNVFGADHHHTCTHHFVLTHSIRSARTRSGRYT
jgi:hypothetical protein